MRWSKQLCIALQSLNSRVFRDFQLRTLTLRDKASAILAEIRDATVEEILHHQTMVSGVLAFYNRRCKSSSNSIRTREDLWHKNGRFIYSYI